MKKQEIKTASEISELTIFSGGGGIIKRHAKVSLDAGTTLLKLDGIPVSFDPETLQIEINPTDKNNILQFTTKKPTKKYIEEQIQQEAVAAVSVINSSVNIGNKRNDIIKVAEEVIKKDYLDENSEISVLINAIEKNEANINYSFILNDLRIKWSPFISVELLDNGEAQIKCLLTIDNKTATSYDNISVKFAEFEIPTEIVDFDDDFAISEMENEFAQQEQVARPRKKKWSKQMVQNRMLF